MPNGNGTGPMGQGPMTGRAMGVCAGNDGPGYANQNPGRGLGRGRGGGGLGRGQSGGRGRRNMFNATGLMGWQRAAVDAPGVAEPAAAEQAELAMLKGQTERFEDTLNALKSRIAELEAKS